MNIHECLTHDYKFKKGIFDREFRYRKITFNNKSKIIRTNQTIFFIFKKAKCIIFLKFRLNKELILEFNYFDNSIKYKNENDFIIKKNQM